MGKYVWIALGLVLFAGAVGALGYRFITEPDALQKYEWIVDRAVEDETSQEAQSSAPKTRGVQPDAPVGAEVRRDRSQDGVDSLRVFEIALDVGNILVGVIGIYLAVSGMRMRRENA